MPINRQRFMNTYVDNVTLNETIDYIENCIAERSINQIIALNVDIIVHLEWDNYFREICNKSDLLLVDGHPLLWAAKFYRQPIKEKICGSDLMPLLCSIAAQKGYSIFILGAAPGVAQTAKEKLSLQYPGLKIAGTYSPPLGFENDPDEIAHINNILSESKADILFVGFGAPKQEIFIYENKEKYNIPVSMSVGGTIDFIAGVQKRAPKWMSNIGLEWFYRLLCDPKRMFKRYIINDRKFFKLVWKYRKNA